MSINRDITERKKVEEKLKQAVKEWETTFNSIKDLISIHDKDFNFVRVNQAFADFFKAKPEELIGKTCYEIVHGTKEPLPNCPYQQVMETKKLVRRELFEPRLGIYVEVTVSPVFNEKEEIVGTVQGISDITDRKRAEEALKKSVELLRDTGEMAQVGGWELDLSTKEISWTEEVGRIHGVEPGYKPKLEEAMNFYAPESRPALEVVLKKAAEMGEPYDLECLFIPSGSKDKIWVRLLGRAVYSGGKIVKLTGTFQNIDKYKRAEEALRESEEKYRALIEASGRAGEGIIIIQDSGEGETVFVFVNDRFCRMSGYSVDELLGRSPWDLVPHEISVRLKDWYKRRHMGESLPSHYEAAGIRKDSTIVPLELSIVTMPWQGKIATVLYLRDITERKQAEEKLRESNAKLQSIFGTAPTGIGMTINHTIEELNHHLCEITGYSKEELLEKSISIVYPSDEDYHSTRREIYKQLTEKGLCTIETCWKRKDGKLISVLLNCAQLQPSNFSQGITFTVLDITERKRAEEMLRISEKFLNNVIENTPNPMWISDERGTVIRMNQALRDLLKITDDEVIGKYDVLKDSQVKEQGLLPLVASVFEKGETVEFEIDYITTREEQVQLSREVHKILDIIISPVKDSQGKVISAVAQHKDITERKKVEEALRESEQRYKGVVDNIGIGVSLISPNMEILFLNNQMKKWFPNIDISKEAVCYRAFNNPPKEEVCSYCPTFKTLRDGHVHESTTETPAGERIINYRVISSPIKDKDGRVIAAIEMVEDITEKNKLQQQLIQTEKLAAVGTLAYGIAHEFNNILAGMMANAELGLITGDSQQVKECFETIVENTQRASSITNNLLAFAQQKEARKDLIDITEPLKSVLSIIHRELEKHNIEIVEEFKPIPKVFCDAGQFSEVFLNMITNARDAMLPLGGTLTVQVEPYKDNVRIIFKDTGCGIPDEIKGRIFEAFVTTKGALGGSEIPGTGLGLFLTYGIVDGYQGRIEVESKVGKGTQFTILIPVTKNLPRKRLLDTVIETPEDIEKKLKILLVDDEKAISFTLKKFLESKGHQVTTSLRAKEGLELFKKDKFDLVLSDITIPDMDGIELIKKMRKEDKDAKIIVITGHILKEKEEKAKEAGADEVLIKPFKNEVLCSAISKVLTGV